MQWNELAAFHQESAAHSHVLVTMVGKRGSSYRQPGSRMLVCDDGRFCGGVSAGCLEDEIAETARQLLGGKGSRLLSIDTRPHYGCPGQITLLLEPLERKAAADMFSFVAKKIGEREPFDVVTDYRSLAAGTTCTRAVAVDEREITPGESVHVQRVGRMPRIVIVGEGEDAGAVAKAAALAKWEVHAVAPEEIQFSRSKIPAKFAPDDRTAVVLLTHNLGLDVASLSEVLPLPYSYVGVIGSLKRRRELIEGLETAGCEEALASLDALHCPAGLDLGAGEAGEIAISILAEIRGLWSGRDAGPLRDRSEPIHRSEQPA